MNIQVLEKHIPQRVLGELPSTMTTFGIETIPDLANFLGQIHYESIAFTHTFENLNYSAEQLIRTFPRHFKDPYTAQLVAHRPEEIANIVYSNRIGNGPRGTGDGWKYRGRGYIQITGRANYQYFDKRVEEDIIGNPDLVATKYPLFSAGWFWKARNINAKSITDAEIMRVTKLVNGGTGGLKERISLTKKYASILSGDTT